MTHYSHEPPHLDNDREDPEGWATWACGIGGSLLVITTVVLSCGIYYTAQSTEAHAKSIDIRYEERDMIRQAQREVLQETSHWVVEKNPETNQTSKRLVIPINDAMQIVAGAND